MKKRKIFISGSISNNPNYEKDFFNAKYALTEDENTVVINPTILPLGLDYADYLDICMAMIRACDEICMLKSWEESKGAMLEHSYAKALGKVMIYQKQNGVFNV